MNIVYCGAFRFPNYDAASHRVLNNGKALRAAGHEILFISWGGVYREKDLCNDGKYRIAGMEYIITDEIDNHGKIGQRLLSLLKRGYKTKAILNKMESETDVIIMYNASRSWTLYLNAYCKKRSIKLVNDITEWYDSNDLYCFQRLPNWINMEFTQRKVKNKIVISSYLDRHFSESHNIIIPPLCDISDSKWENTKDDISVGVYNGITLIYAGTPAKKDSLHTVINVVNDLAYEGIRIRFLVLGTTKVNYLMNYGGILKRREIHDNIIFLGRIPHELIPAYYKKADFMVLLREPKRKNMAGFPTKVSESILSGIPVITNRTSDLGHFICSGMNGYLLNNDSEESLRILLTEKVLLLSKEDINLMKEKTIESRKYFDYSSYVVQLSDFFNNLK